MGRTHVQTSAIRQTADGLFGLYQLSRPRGHWQISTGVQLGRAKHSAKYDDQNLLSPVRVTELRSAPNRIETQGLMASASGNSPRTVTVRLECECDSIVPKMGLCAFAALGRIRAEVAC